MCTRRRFEQRNYERLVRTCSGISLFQIDSAAVLKAPGSKVIRISDFVEVDEEMQTGVTLKDDKR